MKVRQARHPCTARVYREGLKRYTPCRLTGAYEENGKWYCHLHYPPSFVERIHRRRERRKVWLKRQIKECQAELQQLELEDEYPDDGEQHDTGIRAFAQHE